MFLMINMILTQTSIFPLLVSNPNENMDLIIPHPCAASATET